MKTINKNNLLHLIYSPLESRNKSNFNSQFLGVNKLNFSSDSGINFFNIPKITKTNMDVKTPLIINPKKELYIGLELSDSESKLGLINQNVNDIQLINLNEDNTNNTPIMVSFSENKKEIKIGNDAKNELLKNPSQTIFNILKFFGKKMKDIKNHSELLPFRVYSNNDEEDKPFIKINFGPQKDKIIYIDNILSIYLQKVFENFIKKIKFEQPTNNKNNNIRIILVIAVPNYFSYYQRKLLEELFKKEVIPQINNNKNIELYLDKIYIKNSSNFSSLCITSNKIKNNQTNKDILIINIDKDCSNISLVSFAKENKEKTNLKIKASCGMEKGTNHILDDFMFYLLNNRLDGKIKNKILNSPLALVKMRDLCNKIKIELSSNDKAYIDLNKILLGNDLVIDIHKNEFENSLYNFIYDLKQTINKMIQNFNLINNNCAINEIIYIGDIFKDENIKTNLEQLLRNKNLLSEEIFINKNDNSNKELYTVQGALLYAINKTNNLYIIQDISQFNIGIKVYNDTLHYLIKKGEIIPLKNNIKIRIGKNSELQIYEEDNQTKNKLLIGKFVLDNDETKNIYYQENKIINYREISLEYEFDEDLNLTIKLNNGDNVPKILHCKLFHSNV